MRSLKKISAVILASGISSRFGEDKMLFVIDGKPLIVKTVEPFIKSESIDEIVIVANSYNIDKIASLFDNCAKPVAVIEGGNSRHLSSYKGICEASGDYVLIHDGARCFVEEDLIDRVVNALTNESSVIPIVPISDSLVVKNDKRIEYFDRESVKAVQTPQAFDRKKLIDLYDKYLDSPILDQITDNGGLWIQEYPLITVEGSLNNKKITYMGDIKDDSKLKIGNGYDMHRLVEGRRLVLGGICIPHDKGLLGVSDSDVVLHALMDALLSSASLPDIGNQFPSSDCRYNGIDSTVLLSDVLNKVAKCGLKPVSISVTILAQKPRLSPYIHSIKDNIALLCGVSADSVGITSTTTEGLGLIGREEGIACYASVICTNN